MNIKVMYHSQSGNTKKVAESMAEALGVEAEKITGNSIDDPIDVLFIGDGVYAGEPDKTTVSFIKTLNSSIVKNAAVFGTYGKENKAVSVIKELLEKQGIKVLKESFGCKGKFFAVFNCKHPSAEELSAAKEFARRVSNAI